MAHTVVSDKLTLRLLNSDVVTKDISSSDALVKAIAANKEDPKLFRERMVFQKVEN